MVLTITMCICGGTLYGVAQSINIEKELWLCTGIEQKICKRIKSYAT